MHRSIDSSRVERKVCSPSLVRPAKECRPAISSRGDVTSLTRTIGKPHRAREKKRQTVTALPGRGVSILSVLGKQDFEGRNTTMGGCTPYRVVRGWPILPEGYVLGQVCGVGVNSARACTCLSSRRSCGQQAGRDPSRRPAVMCFDGATGTLLDSWGANIFQVPPRLRVDDRDNIWITDVELHQVFKFSHDGTLRMSLGVAGKPGLGRRAF